MDPNRQHLGKASGPPINPGMMAEGLRQLDLQYQFGFIGCGAQNHMHVTIVLPDGKAAGGGSRLNNALVCRINQWNIDAEGC